MVCFVQLFLQTLRHARKGPVPAVAIVFSLALLAATLSGCPGAREEKKAGPKPQVLIEPSRSAAAGTNEERQGPSTLAPSPLEGFADIPAQPASAADLARELDAPFYSPANEGVSSLAASFRCNTVEEFLRGWMDHWELPEEEVAAASLTVRYRWTPAGGNEVELEGWPDEFQPLEKKRHTNILQGMAELIVPPPHASYLDQYDLSVRRSEAGVLITARARAQQASMERFQKLFGSDWSATYLQGVGKVSPFENLTRYVVMQRRRVIEEQLFYVESPAAVLRYTVRPEYQDAQGLLLPARIAQTYRDEAGEPKGRAVALELIGSYEVGR